MMFKRTCGVAFICFTCAVGILHLNAAEAVNEIAREEMTFTSVKTENGRLIQVEVGDMVFLAPSLSFQHENGSPSEVRVVEEQIEIRFGKHRVTANRITIPVRSGALSLRPALALKASR